MSASTRKMSVVLLEFAGHFLTHAGVRDWAENEGVTNNLLLTAAAAWNTALSPIEEREQRLTQLLGSFPREVAEALKPLARQMITHKDANYSDDRRVISRCKVVYDGGGVPSLEVESAPVP